MQQQHAHRDMMSMPAEYICALELLHQEYGSEARQYLCDTHSLNNFYDERQREREKGEKEKWQK